MYSVWAKRLLPAPVATGTVCLTMHLTNQQKTMLDALQTLSLMEQPKIEEQELTPVVPVKPKQSSDTGPGAPDTQDSNGPTNDQQPQDSQDQESQPQPSNSDSSQQVSSSEQKDAPQSPAASVPSSVDATSDKDIKDVIKELVQEIDHKQSSWVRNPRSLSSIHEMFTRFKGLNEALKNYKQQQTPGQA